MKKLPILVLLTGISVNIMASDLDEAADDACDCMKAPYAKMEEVKAMVMQAMASGDYNKMTAMEGEFASLQDSTQACFDGLRKKYPHIDQSRQLQEEVSAKMEAKCPPPQMGFAPPGQ